MVDLRGDHVLHRVGQVVEAAGRSRRRDQRLQEQRVPARPLGQHRHLVRSERRVLRRLAQHRGGGAVIERLRPHGGDELELLTDEAGVDLASGHHHEPWPSSDVARETAQQLCGCLVHPVDVLDRDSDGAGSSVDRNRAVTSST